MTSHHILTCFLPLVSNCTIYGLYFQGKGQKNWHWAYPIWQFGLQKTFDPLDYATVLQKKECNFLLLSLYGVLYTYSFTQGGILPLDLVRPCLWSNLSFCIHVQPRWDNLSFCIHVQPRWDLAPTIISPLSWRQGWNSPQG